ncbi:MAG: SCO family protein [Burkholderiales bacterium]|nr:SCO family protein [Burkholderiales bacterium]
MARKLPQLDAPARFLLAAALGLAILLVSGLLLAQELPAGTTFDPRAALERSQAAVGNTLGDYTLTGIDGGPVRLASYRGKPLIVSFVYTGCFQVCPTTTRFLERAVIEAQRAVGPGTFSVITVGFNLPFDSPAAMRDFQTRHGISTPGWRFLAADRATVDNLARDVGFAWIAAASGFDHVTQATIVDANGRVVRQVYGDAFELPMFVAPIKDLVAGEAVPAQTLADLVEKVRILCTVYDPRTGRYRLDYALFIEIAAGLTILGATAWYLASEWRRQRRARPS